MSANGYAFVNADLVVVNAIGGELDEKQLTQFEHDYGVIFDAEFSVPVYEGTTVWVGGRYNPNTGEFSPPVEPESQEQV
jgi:hypothetical protein